MRFLAHSSPRRAGLAVAAAVTIASVFTACKPPPPPPPHFLVARESFGADAKPGDRICATARGTCSLQAAVQESNALGRAVISTGLSDYEAMELTVTGNIEFRWDGTRTVWLGNLDLTVAHGAVVVASDIDLRSARVEGTLLLRRAYFGDGVTNTAIQDEPYLDVAPGGTAVLMNTLVSGQYAPFARNAGQLTLHGVNIAKGPNLGPDIPALTTLAGGSTRLNATVFEGDPTHSVDACAGEAPLSGGYNLVYDDTCRLAAATDRIETSAVPEHRSQRIDAIPYGVLGCGTTWTDDIGSRGGGPGAAKRPIDANADGIRACDSGIYEFRPEDIE